MDRMDRKVLRTLIFGLSFILLAVIAFLAFGEAVYDLQTIAKVEEGGDKLTERGGSTLMLIGSIFVILLLVLTVVRLYKKCKVLNFIGVISDLVVLILVTVFAFIVNSQYVELLPLPMPVIQRVLLFAMIPLIIGTSYVLDKETYIALFKNLVVSEKPANIEKSEETKPIEEKVQDTKLVEEKVTKETVETKEEKTE